jgi:hypothetical protein
MSETKPGPLEIRQRSVDRYESMQTHLDGRQAEIHTSMPGRIVSFNPQKMTAVVQPALTGFNTQLDGTRKPLNITTIADVPVHFPAGGGFTLTFPVKAGDECLIVFSERSIDNWHQHGGTQEPSDWRMHDINDAVVHVGLRSQPNVIPNVHATNVQLRSDDGNSFVEISAGGITLKTPGTLTINAAAIVTTGTFTNNGVNISSTHTHSDPQGGSVGPPH